MLRNKNNGIHSTMRPARFDEASFNLPASGAIVDIVLKY